MKDKTHAGIQIVSAGIDSPDRHRADPHHTQRTASSPFRRGIDTRETILLVGCLNNRQRNFCQLQVANTTEPVVMLTDSQFAVSHLIPINIDGSLSRTFTECTRGVAA